MTTRLLLLAALLALLAPLALSACATTGGRYADARAQPTQSREAQNGLRRYFDAGAKRYYTINSSDGCTYWTSGELRGC